MTLRNRRLAVTSSLAIATALLVGRAPEARAQSFQGTGTVVAGSATIGTGSGTTTITVNTPSAVIDWTATDTAISSSPIIWQPSGTTATFTNNISGVTDFAVLNRILPVDGTRQIQFDGHVISQIQSAAAGPATGGTVYFYSPGGILVGAGVFDVGNLGLTSSPVVFNASTGDFDTTGTVSFQPANTGSRVDVLSGGQINANGYVAMVSPVVTNAGTINLTASSGNPAAAALVAADAADITFSPDGLLNITVTQGTAANGTVLSNSGAITGLTGTGLTSSHRVYLVAIPQNQAITMAITSGSTLGFDVAGSADTDGNAVILSAGYDVSAGEAMIAPSASGGSGAADISLTNTAVTSRFSARSSGTANVNAINGVTSFASDATVLAVSTARAFAQGASGSLTVAGNAEFSAIDPHTFIGSGAGAAAGNAFIIADTGGHVDVTGNLRMVTNAFGGDTFTGTTGSGTAGQINLQAQAGGAIHVTGLTNLSADGFSGFASGPNTSSGNASGGNILIAATDNGSTINLDSDVAASAKGLTGNSFGTGTSGTATGGTIRLLATGVSSSTTGNAVTLGGAYLADATAVGGDGFTAGSNAFGGQASIVGDTGGTVSIAAQTTLNGGGFGGNMTGAGTAGNGNGGTVTISANTGGAVTFNDFVGAYAHGAGGGATATPPLAGSAGGVGRGGQSSINASGGTITINAGFTVDTSGFGGEAASGGNGIGGNSIVQAFNSGTLTVNDFDFGVNVLADGQAGAGQLAGGVAGNGFGGNAQIVATGSGNANITALGLNVTAKALRSSRPGVDGTAGGVGTGGTASISQGSLGRVAITSDVTVDTLGEGSHSYGGGTGIGGTGRGGDSRITVNDSAGLSITGNAVVSAYGDGGDGAASVGSSSGGAGIGGVANIGATGGANVITGDIVVNAEAFGGDALSSGNGGSATGGLAIVGVTTGATAGSISFGGANGSSITAYATGGIGNASGAGGNATGGTAQIFATGGNVSTTSSLQLVADGAAGSSVDGLAGTGTGGTASALVDTVNLNIGSTFLAQAFGQGGVATGIGSGGSSVGGVVSIVARNSGSGTFGSDVTADATGNGGNATGLAGDGGAARGGNATLQANNSGSIAVTGLTTVNASAIGGAHQFSGTGTPTGNGADATGGTAFIQDFNAGTLNLTSAVTLKADATGGNSQFTNADPAIVGGDAQGGGAHFFTDGTTTLGSTLAVSANAVAGFGNAAGGSATGGQADISSLTGNITVAGDTSVFADATGGVSIAGAAGATGGSALGGRTSISTTSGTFTFNGNVRVAAFGNGGRSDTIAPGSGGAGTGGVAQVVVNGTGAMNFTVTGNAPPGPTGAPGQPLGLYVLTQGNGGFGFGQGFSTGAGTGGQSTIDVSNGGSVTVSGFTQVGANAFAGNSSNGAFGADVGGTGTGGDALILSTNGTFTANQVSIQAVGFGGNARVTAGSGIGGSAKIHAANSATGTSQITVGAVSAFVQGNGGSGTQGINPGDAGGTGGNGQGGTVIITAAAGNGNLVAGAVNAGAFGQGGSGAVGLANATGTGGNGGAGGIGTGGIINIGTESGLSTPNTSGTATYASIQESAQGTGGAGGNGGTGTTAGNGGNGGAAFNGAAVLLVRGSSVTVTGATNLGSNATGGNGGTGAVAGLGGDATVGGNGGIGITVTNRFQVPTQRGTLNAGAITGAANAVGGTGSTNGQAIVSDSPVNFTLTNADATIASVDISANGSTLTAAALPSVIDVSGGAANIAGRFGFATAGDLSLTIGAGSLTADVVDVFGHNWILGTAPATVGTLTGTTSLTLSSSNNLAAYANLRSNGSISLISSGLIRFDDLTSGGSIFAQAQGPITLGVVNGTNTVDLLSSANITTLAATAGGYLNYESLGSVSTGALTAGEYIEVDSLGGPATINGNVQAGDYFTLQANGAVSVGNVTAGIVSPSNNPLATYRVGIAGNGNVSVGTVQARNDIGLLANGGLVTASGLTGRDMLVLASTGASINGSITSSGRVLFADASMAPLGGTFTNFDPNPIFAATPTAMAGTVLLGGAAQSTGRFQVATTSDFVANAAVTGSNGLIVNAGGFITAAGVLTGRGVALNSGLDLTAGAINSFAQTSLFSSQGTITTGNITSMDRVLIIGKGRVTLGNVVSDPNAFAAQGIPPASLANTVHIGSGGSVVAGNIRSIQSTTVVAGQDITTGQINSRQDIALLPTESLTTGSLLAGIVVNPATGQLTNATGRILIGKSTMLQAGGTLGNLDYNALFNSTPIAIDGSVLDNGGAAALYLRSYSGGSFSAGGIRTFNDITVDSGGLVTVRQQWASPDISIQSTDIDIQQAQPLPTNPNPPSGLNAGTTGQISLVSTSNNPALIGDGLTGTGYSLSQAEFSRINSGSVLIAAVDKAANPIDMFIGNLAMTGPLAGSTIDDPNGKVIFATATLNAGGGGTPSGALRITGALTGTGFRDTNTLEFDTGLFELDAATGSISLSGSALTTLAGTIEINAKNIHVAEGSILTKLEADPLYAGHIADLNRPTVVSRPGGVLSAAALDLFPTQTLYIQNTGTVLTPAGFIAGPNVDVTPPQTPPTGGIEVVVNGQFVTANGTLTGKAAYDALIASGPAFTGFSALSQLNGCLFVGGCPTGVDPVPDLASEIEVLTDSDMSDSPVITDEPDETSDQEQSEEEKAAEDAAEDSPIIPAAPLIDTRPMNPPRTITEPVAGSGNPALIGSVVNEGTAQGDAQ